MTATGSPFDTMLTALVPSLSRSLAEQFNVFRVMHHGTHEKQLSNVFAWLLDPNGTHELGDTFQRLFVAHVNRVLTAETRVPASGYRALQEVDTSGPEGLNKDIADIVLTSPEASVIIENYEASDGHGHNYHRYLDYGRTGEKPSVVVLLCVRHEPYRLTSGWENAVIVTYAEVLENLKIHVDGDAMWRRSHPRQHFFINEMVQHYIEGPSAVSTEDQIQFIKTMCETGESARYGMRPHESQADRFASDIARYAKRQFEDGRKLLADVKRALRSYAQHTLTAQINDVIQSGKIRKVTAQFAGQWVWCVTLDRADEKPTIFLEFGPTAVVENARNPSPLADPDFGRIFITRRDLETDGIDLIHQTDVGLDEVIVGLSPEDTRLRDAVLAAINTS